MMKNFALIGAARYVAPRRMQVIKANDNDLAAILDLSDLIEGVA